MNDLLTSLVDRALDRAPVLQRRQPTLFEPIAEASLGEQSQFSNTPPLEEEEIVVESRPSLERQKLSIINPSPLRQPSLGHEEQQSQPVETRPIRPRRVDDNPPPQIDHDNAPVSTVARKDAAIRLEEQRRESRTPVVAKPEEITVAPKRLIETIVERRVEREVIKEQATPQPAIEEVHALTRPISQPKVSPDDSRPKPALKAEAKRPAPPKEETAIKPLVKQDPAPRRDVPPYIRAVARAESRHSLKQETPPVIHVTIGRVEVRATPAAANKPRSARTAGPTLSLDDYLSSRSKGNQ